jgi:hypothetical protein
VRHAGVAQCSIRLRTGRPGFDPRQRQRIFPLTYASRPALGPTHPPIQWVPGALSPGVKRGRDVKLTIHPLLVPRLRKSRSYTSSHTNAPLWSLTGPLFLTFTMRHALLLIEWTGCRPGHAMHVILKPFVGNDNVILDFCAVSTRR